MLLLLLLAICPILVLSVTISTFTSSSSDTQFAPLTLTSGFDVQNVPTGFQLVSVNRQTSTTIPRHEIPFQFNFPLSFQPIQSHIHIRFKLTDCEQHQPDSCQPMGQLPVCASRLSSLPHVNSISGYNQFWPIHASRVVIV
jgi:hypothetical protein